MFTTSAGSRRRSTTSVEGPHADAAVIGVFVEKERRDEKSGQREEHRHADDAAGSEARSVGMGEQDEEHGDAAQPVQCRSVTKPPHLSAHVERVSEPPDRMSDGRAE